MPRTRLLGPAAGLLLGLIATPVLAGEWVPVESLLEGLSAITYRSEKMLPGEEATLFYRGTDVDMASVSGLKMDLFLQNTVMMQIALTSGDEPIIGFEGVTLRQERDGEDIMVLYDVVNDEDAYSFLRPACGTNTLQDLPDGTEPICSNSCFRSYDDAALQRDAVACNGGEAHWILIVIVGTLREQLGSTGSDKAIADAIGSGPRKSYDQIMASANYLIVHVKENNSSHTNFPLDDTFRLAMWNLE